MTVKRILLLAAMLSGAVMAHAQGMLFQSIAQTVTTIPGSAQGASQVFVPIPSAIVTVCTGTYTGIACNTQTASVYQDQALTIPITPNVTGDTVGNFWFWAAPGTYYYTVRGTVGGATVTGTYQLQLPASISGSTISAGIFNATTGFEVGGLAPLNHVLLGNGTDYIDSATIPASIVTGLPGSFYQYVQSAGTSQPQETKLNFADSVFALSDAAGTSQTNVNMNRTGVASKIVTASAAGTSGQAATWNASGDLVSAAFQTPVIQTRTCNTNGCYRIEADGTIEEWGPSSAAVGGGTAATLSIVFPLVFPTLTDMRIITSPTGNPSGDGNPHPMDCHIQSTSITTAGASAIISIPTQVGGSGYSALTAGDYCSWTAWGHQ